MQDHTEQVYYVKYNQNSSTAISVKELYRIRRSESHPVEQGEDTRYQDDFNCVIIKDHYRSELSQERENWNWLQAWMTFPK
jgi:hypothetical protein